MNNPFIGIESATKSKSGRYLCPGNWDLQVVQVKLQDSKKNHGVTYFIAEFDVMTTDVEDFTKGDRVSWLVDLSQREDMWQADIKDFCMAIVGLTTETETENNKVTAEGTFALCQPDNPARGLKVSVRAYNHLTKRENHFTKTDWRPYAG